MWHSINTQLLSQKRSKFTKISIFYDLTQILQPLTWASEWDRWKPPFSSPISLVFVCYCVCGVPSSVALGSTPSKKKLGATVVTRRRAYTNTIINYYQINYQFRHNDSFLTWSCLLKHKSSWTLPNSNKIKEKRLLI